MADTNFFPMENLKNKPEFDFLSQFNTDNSTNGGINDNNNIDCPYSNSDIKCSFIDINSFCNKFANEKRLSLMCLNIQSLPAKFNEFSDLISQLSTSDCCPDVICLQELWQLRDPAIFNITGYTFFSLLQNSNTQGGGVGIYVKIFLTAGYLTNIPHLLTKL